MALARGKLFLIIMYGLIILYFFNNCEKTNLGNDVKFEKNEEKFDEKNEKEGKQKKKYVIYGEDDRKERYEVSVDKQNIAAATVAIVASKYLEEKNEEYINKAPTFNQYLKKKGEKVGLCSSEKYRTQYVLADCSGFLISSDIMLTAGHCIRDQKECKKNFYVFDYALLNKTDNKNGPKKIKKENVYFCKEFLFRKFDFSYDVAVVRLDHSVEDRNPLSLRSSTERKMSVGDALFMVGYPFGLPVKIVENASVLAIDEEISNFYVDADLLPGNSGSPLLSEAKDQVEGILSASGEPEFTVVTGKKGHQCKISYNCSEDKKEYDNEGGERKCQGGEIMDISLYLELFPEIPTYQFADLVGRTYYKTEEKTCESLEEISKNGLKISFSSSKNASKAKFYNGSEIKKIDFHHMAVSNDLKKIIFKGKTYCSE